MATVLDDDDDGGDDDDDDNAPPGLCTPMSSWKCRSPYILRETTPLRTPSGVERVPRLLCPGREARIATA
eukprot:6440383-Pyramimonas_sp.AAC.1